MDLMARRRMMTGSSAPTPPTPATPVFYDKLVFDGVAYIDTDIVPGASDSFKCTFGNETLKATQQMFMFRCTSNGYTGAAMNSSTNTTRRVFSILYGSTSSLSTNRAINFTEPTYGFFLTPKRFGWGNASYTISKGSQTPTGGMIIGSHANNHAGQPYTGKISTFYIYGSDAQNVTTSSGFSSYTPTHTLRPCTYNGAAGLWCVETSTFYGNTAGSGTLSVENL